MGAAAGLEMKVPLEVACALTCVMVARDPMPHGHSPQPHLDFDVLWGKLLHFT